MSRRSELKPKIGIETMAHSMNTATAKIYQFPVPKRTSSAALAGDAQVIELRPAAAPEIVYCAGSSYHEAAIAEDMRSRKA